MLFALLSRDQSVNKIWSQSAAVWRVATRAPLESSGNSGKRGIALEGRYSRLRANGCSFKDIRDVLRRVGYRASRSQTGSDESPATACSRSDGFVVHNTSAHHLTDDYSLILLLSVQVPPTCTIRRGKSNDERGQALRCLRKVDDEGADVGVIGQVRCSFSVALRVTCYLEKK